MSFNYFLLAFLITALQPTKLFCPGLTTIKSPEAIAREDNFDNESPTPGMSGSDGSPERGLVRTKSRKPAFDDSYDDFIPAPYNPNDTKVDHSRWADFFPAPAAGPEDRLDVPVSFVRSPAKSTIDLSPLFEGTQSIKAVQDFATKNSLNLQQLCELCLNYAQQSVDLARAQVGFVDQPTQENLKEKLDELSEKAPEDDLIIQNLLAQLDQLDALTSSLQNPLKKALEAADKFNWNRYSLDDAEGMKTFMQTLYNDSNDDTEKIETLISKMDEDLRSLPAEYSAPQVILGLIGSIETLAQNVTTGFAIYRDIFEALKNATPTQISRQSTESDLSERSPSTLSRPAEPDYSGPTAQAVFSEQARIDAIMAQARRELAVGRVPVATHTGPGAPLEVSDVEDED